MFTGMYIFIAFTIILIVGVNIMRVKFAKGDKKRMDNFN
jgi:hypothetical protein